MMTKKVPSTDLLTGLAHEEDVAARLLEFVQDRDAFSANTWTQLMSVMSVCWRWSRENQRSFLPMSSGDLRDYMMWLREAGRASSTIATHTSMISMLHRNAGLVPPNGSPLVFRAMKKINRLAVVSGERTGQALPLSLNDLYRIDDRWAESSRLQDVRNLAFLHVAYSTLMRISELARIRIRDLSRAEDRRFIVDVSHTKTIVQTGGLIKALSSFSSQRLEEWINIAGLNEYPDAYLFCRVHRNNKPMISCDKPLSRPAIEDIFRKAWEIGSQGLPTQANKNRYRRWSGHSTRVGAAQDMARKGYTVAQIMQEGTWKKPETLMRYIRKVDAHSGAMVDMMEGADRAQK